MDTGSTQISAKRKSLAKIAGPLLFFSSFFYTSPDILYPSIPIMIGLTAWMAIWWLTECVHIAVTSFIPFIVLPVCGITDIKVVSAQYMDPILFLFIGGFLLSFSIEKWGLHRRLAIGILSQNGKTAGNILTGVMLTAFLISMWISNTATTMMLLSAVLAVTHQIKEHVKDHESHRKISTALLIGLAYASNIGGMATLVGTPTNMIFYRIYNEHYGTSNPIDFTDWLVIALPVSVLLLIFTLLTLRLTLLKKQAGLPFDINLFKVQQKALGKWNRDETNVAVIFLITVILWFTRSNIEMGDYIILGWGSLFPYPTQITDGTVAVFMAMLLFLIPSGSEPGRALLSWQEASKIPYEIILLFGSGFALSKGFETSGLSNWIAQQLHGIKHISPIYMIIAIGLVVTIISEFASNVASIQLVMPVVIALQSGLDLHPAMLTITAALAASLGFMLPVATAPNTIVFSSGHIKVGEMVKAGLFINLAGIALIALILSLYF